MATVIASSQLASASVASAPAAHARIGAHRPSTAEERDGARAEAAMATADAATKEGPAAAAAATCSVSTVLSLPAAPISTSSRAGAHDFGVISIGPVAAAVTTGAVLNAVIWMNALPVVDVWRVTVGCL